MSIFSAVILICVILLWNKKNYTINLHLHKGWNPELFYSWEFMQYFSSLKIKAPRKTWNLIAGCHDVLFAMKSGLLYIIDCTCCYARYLIVYYNLLIDWIIVIVRPHSTIE